MTKLAGLPRGLRGPWGMLDAVPFQNWPTQVHVHIELGLGKVAELRYGTPEKRQDARDFVQLMADQWLGLCEYLELESAARDYEFIRDDLHAGLLRDDERLADKLDDAARAFRADLEERYFFRVAAGKKDYFGAGFGDAVATAFPSAAFDIREANTCFALERYVASILHLVRAAEVALHALAKERGVKFPDAPLPWKEWGQIIENIESKVKATAPARGPQKDAFLHFYNGALGELTALKDVYRNVWMHTRPGKKTPGELEARDALVAARGLFQRLAVRLTEQGKRINWKKES
jgi:hypothetical protein